jgi:hypothetical protein
MTAGESFCDAGEAFSPAGKKFSGLSELLPDVFLPDVTEVLSRYRLSRYWLFMNIGIPCKIRIRSSPQYSNRSPGSGGVVGGVLRFLETCS